MDKNNDIQVNKVSKWEAAPENMGSLFTYIELVIGMACCLPHEIHDNLYDLMDKTLDEYNELEAKYQESCGMISQYEEENRILREQTKFVKDSDKFRREHDRYAYHLEGLCRTLSDNDIIADWSEAALKWNLYKWDEVKGQWCSYDKATTLESCKEHYEEELRIKEKEKDDKDKLIEELTHENMVLKLKNYTNGIYGLTGKIELLNKEIDDLKMENKNLKHFKDVQERNEDFGKYVGKSVAESIREGWEHNLYKLHPYTRIDIHVEQIMDMSFAFNHCAIPRISVMFNNSQTEMERDTAQHECEELNEKCEELNEKIDTVWRANDELNRKIKELEKEKIDLKTTLALCERDANMARELCHTVAFNAEHARNKTPLV